MGLSYLQSITSQRPALDQSATLLKMEDYGMDVDMDVDLDPIDHSHNQQQVVKASVSFFCSRINKLDRSLTSHPLRFQHSLEMVLIKMR